MKEPTERPEKEDFSWLEDDTSKAFSMLMIGVIMLVLGFVLGRIVP